MRCKCLLFCALLAGVAGCYASSLDWMPYRQPGRSLLQNVQNCDSDDYKSRLRVRHLTPATGSSPNTFTFDILAMNTCQSQEDVDGCCEADLREIWVDINAARQVTSVKANGISVPFGRVDDGSLKIDLPTHTRLREVTSGLRLEINVQEGTASLCNQPSIVPVRGLCQFMLVGGSKKQCCPLSVSRTTAPEASELYDKSSSFGSCFGTGLPRSNSVIRAKFDTFEFNDTHTTISFTHDAEEITCGWEAYFKGPGSRSAVVLAAQRPVDAISYDWSFRWIFSQEKASRTTYTIVVPGKHVAVSSLCSSKTDLYPNQAEGECVFVKYTKAGSQLVVLKAGPAHDGTPGCSPELAREPKDTNIKLAYYTYLPNATSTIFYFQVSVGTACPLEPCNGLCGWSLFLKSSITKGLAEDTGVFRAATHALVTTGANSSVTWTLEQVTSSQKYYKLTVPGNVNLRSLCAQNTLAGQGNADCAAVLRTKDYSVRVFFSEADRIVKDEGLYVCDEPKPLSGSCATVVSSHKQLSRASSTVTSFGFTVAVQNTGDCAGQVDGDYQLQVMLQPGYADELVSSKAHGPLPLVLSSAAGVTWKYNKVDANALYGFTLKEKIDFANLCKQNMYADQPSGSCVVELKSTNKCLRGFIRTSEAKGDLLDYGIVNDGINVVIKKSDELSKGEVAGIVIGVVVPVVLAGVAAAFWFKRRSRARQNKYSVQDPLVDGSVPEVGYQSPAQVAQ